MWPRTDRSDPLPWHIGHGACAARMTPVPARFSGMGQLIDLTSFARQIEGQVGKPPANVANWFDEVGIEY